MVMSAHSGRGYGDEAMGIADNLNAKFQRPIHMALNSRCSCRGDFILESFKVSPELGEKIESYISKIEVRTYIRNNLANTCINSYTPRFTVRAYYNQSNYPEYYFLHRQSKMGKYKSDPERYLQLLEKTPTLDQLFSWCRRKYLDQIVWVNGKNAA